MNLPPCFSLDCPLSILPLNNLIEVLVLLKVVVGSYAEVPSYSGRVSFKSFCVELKFGRSDDPYSICEFFFYLKLARRDDPEKVVIMENIWLSKSVIKIVNKHALLKNISLYNTHFRTQIYFHFMPIQFSNSFFNLFDGKI